MELKLEEWKVLCDVAINKTINQMHEKKMTLNDAGKMKRCVVRLLRSNLEVLFEVNEGKTKNTAAAHAWKAVSECVGNDNDPKEKTKTKGGKKGGKKNQRPNDNVKSPRKSQGGEKTQQKQVQNSQATQPPINICRTKNNTLSAKLDEWAMRQGRN